MLLLVTILLVVVGAISLVIGYVQSSLPPIYLSIACSVVAFGVLLIFARMSSRSNRAGTSSAGPAPLDFDRPQPAERTQPVPAMAGSGGVGRSATSEAFAPDDDDAPSRYDAPASSRYAAALDATEDDDEDEVVEDDFPIERYDSRRVGEILPLLAELDVDELDMVREHEERGKARATVLARIDQLIDQLEAEDRDEAEHRFDPEPEVDEAPAPPPPPPPPPPAAPQPIRVADLPEDDDDYFPIEDYDDLRASEILPLLPELDDDELEMVRRRESAEMGRQSILHRIDALLQSSSTAPGGPGPVPAPPLPEPEPEPEPEPVVSEIPPPPPVKRSRAAKATGERSSKATAAKDAPAPVVASLVPPAKAPAKAAKSTSKSAPAKTAKAPAKAAKAPAKAAKEAVGKAAKAVAPAKGPVQKTPAPRKKAAAEKAPPLKVVPVKKAAKGAGAGASSTPAAKTTKRTSKR